MVVEILSLTIYGPVLAQMKNVYWNSTWPKNVCREFMNSAYQYVLQVFFSYSCYPKCPERTKLHQLYQLLSSYPFSDMAKSLFVPIIVECPRQGARNVASWATEERVFAEPDVQKMLAALARQTHFMCESPQMVRTKEELDNYLRSCE